MKITTEQLKKCVITTSKSFIDWLLSLSDKTLNLCSIAILHLVFLPQYVAYLNGLIDKLPNLDTYIILLIALGLMMLRAIIKKDMIAILIHSVGFISQILIMSFILLK